MEHYLPILVRCHSSVSRRLFVQRAPREESVAMKGGISTASRDDFVGYLTEVIWISVEKYPVSYSQ